MSCFQGLFFCPEAASLLLHNFCIYHISPPGHEVCKFIDLNAFSLLYLELNIIIHSFSSGTSTRVLAVGSSFNLFRGSCSFCWRLSRSNNWGPQPFWVIGIYLQCSEFIFWLLCLFFWATLDFGNWELKNTVLFWGQIQCFCYIY